MSYASFAFEILVCVLLAAAAIMCWRVDRRLRTLRDGQDGLRDTIGALNDAVDRARASLAALDRASKEQGAALKAEVDSAQRISDELRFLSEAGETRLSRLENARRATAAEPVERRRTSTPARVEALKELR